MSVEELVKQLRHNYEMWALGSKGPPILVEAADKLEELAAENEALREALSNIIAKDSYIDASPRGGRKIIYGDFAKIARNAGGRLMDRAPVRIFLAPNVDHINPWAFPLTTYGFDEDGTEYVRADKLAELAAENERLRRELSATIAERKRAQEACQQISENTEAALAEKDKEIAAMTYQNEVQRDLIKELRNAGGKDAE